MHSFAKQKEDIMKLLMVKPLQTKLSKDSRTIEQISHPDLQLRIDCLSSKPLICNHQLGMRGTQHVLMNIMC
ncbi:hypothetical protein KIN20_034608 [Parelaphostrongylus tenuis]|uniref:Uncharacterized protein n=1 Tax=Parelaphostrongylus tenuis TaxID=148309 RepID=A0AAD5WJV0_PARTN|nr:hypothetical protein KIN20_034608 [Parelaphostrongylus tenuis]